MGLEVDMVWQGVQEEHIRANLNPEITMNLIRELRDYTGYGVEACKQALRDTNGELREAQEYLRCGRDKWLKAMWSKYQ